LILYGHHNIIIFGASELVYWFEGPHLNQLWRERWEGDNGGWWMMIYTKFNSNFYCKYIKECAFGSSISHNFFFWEMLYNILSSYHHLIIYADVTLSICLAILIRSVNPTRIYRVLVYAITRLWPRQPVYDPLMTRQPVCDTLITHQPVYNIFMTC